MRHTAHFRQPLVGLVLTVMIAAGEAAGSGGGGSLGTDRAHLSTKAPGVQVLLVDDTVKVAHKGGSRSRGGEDSGRHGGHERWVVLSDVGHRGAGGMVKLERKRDGRQEVHIRASGLIAGGSYRVLLDGGLAAVVVADGLGVAWLELESWDDSHPLRADLQSVEALRLVEWVDVDGSVILSARFSGRR